MLVKIMELNWGLEASMIRYKVEQTFIFPELNGVSVLTFEG